MSKFDFENENEDQFNNPYILQEYERESLSRYLERDALLNGDEISIRMARELRNSRVSEFDISKVLSRYDYRERADLEKRLLRYRSDLYPSQSKTIEQYRKEDKLNKRYERIALIILIIILSPVILLFVFIIFADQLGF